MKTSVMLPLGTLGFPDHAYLAHREGHRSRRAGDPIFYSRKEQKKMGEFQVGVQQHTDRQTLSHSQVIAGFAGMTQSSGP